MKKYQNIAPDAIFRLNDEFKADPRPNKVNAGIGIYLDELGKPFVIPIVSKVASSLDFKNFNYLPISGDTSFLDESTKLIFGNNLYNKFNDKLAKQGVVGGTNGIYLWANLISKKDKNQTIIISTPTWENHNKILKNFGFNIIEFPQLDKNNKFNFKALEKEIVNNPNSYVLFQGGPTHNPTSVNPSNEEWKLLSKLLKKNNNSVLFDFAYAGLGDDLESDCFGVRHILENKIPMSVNFSYSKNMTLYQHRTGILIVLIDNDKDKLTLESNLKFLFRINNSTPPAFGELIVKNILQNETYKKEWLNTLLEMSASLKKRRQLFNEYSNNRFNYILDQKGFFSLLNLTTKQVEILKTKYAIYLLPNSRINFAGISLEKIPYVAKIISSM